MASSHDGDQGQHVRQRTSSSALDSGLDREVVDILRELAEHGVHQVAEDDISDEEHARLDLLVLTKLGADFHSVLGVFKVIGQVVETCPRLSTAPPSIMEFLDFVEKHDAISALVQHAVKTSSFKYIRRLSFLQSAKESSQNSSATSAKATGVELAWHGQFHGDRHIVLCDTITKLSAKAGFSPYGNILPVVQSSGTGKSRVAREAAGLIFSLLVTIREPSDSTAYPPTDLTAYNYFHSFENTRKKQEYIYEAFLSEWFKVAASHLCERIPEKKYSSMTELAVAWRDYLEDGGQTAILEDAVKNAAHEKYKYGSPEIGPQRRSTGAVSTLCDAIKSRISAGGHHRVILTVYVDEVSSLMEKTLEGTSCTLYEIFLSAWVTATKNQPVFLLTLSTNFHPPSIAPSRALHPSQRTIIPSAYHHAPFTELVFDVIPAGTFLFEPDKYSLSDVADARFMLRFGRPLWRTLRNSHGSLHSLFTLAFKKQKQNAGRCRYVDSVRVAEDKRLSLVAIVGTRVLFDLDTSLSASRQSEKDLIASYMRIAFSVPHHQEYIRSGTPSEPILAEVAAMGMHRFEADAVDVVGKELASGLIDGNTRTGLVARLLLIMAYDRALKNLHARERTSIASYSRAVPVRDFLRALVAEAYISDVLGCKPDEAGDPQVSLEEAFDGAFVRFSHFARNGVDNAIDTHAGLAAVARGMAIQCCEGRGSVDIVVPIVLKDEKLKEDVMSTMLIQVVNDRDGRVSPLDITAESLGVFPRVHNGREEDQRPYIVIAMQLGAMASAKNAWFVGPSRTREVPGVPRVPLPCRPGDLTARSTHRTHPRYYINIDGCSHKVYGVISEADSPRFAGILAAGGLFSEHSRPELEAEVQELKPEWNRNRACYGWTDQPELWSSSKEGERIVQEKIVCGAATAEPWQFPARTNHQVENICET